jgi:hypothetical protein
MSERFLIIVTSAIILCLFVYGFDFKNNVLEQIALLVSGYLFGNLTTIADYAKDDNAC